MMKLGHWPFALALVATLGGCGIFKGGTKKTPVLGERVPILLSESNLTVDRSLDGVEVLLPPAEANAEWSQPGGNAAKAMGHLALSTTPARAWTATIAGGSKKTRLGAAPTIAGGKLYVMDTEGAVQAFDAASGARLWSVSTVKDEVNASARFGGGVSVEGARVFATNGIGEVVALDANTGAEAWRTKPGGPLRGSPTLANGQVYAVSQDNQLFALDQTSGQVVWTQSGSLESQGVFGVAAPAAAQGTIVAGFSSGELNAYRYENGRSLWADALSRTSASTSVSALADIDAEPVIDQGRVYAIGEGGRMVALEVVSGQRLWEQNLAGISTPWVAGEWIFVVTDDARLLCLARSTGRVRWITQLPRWRNAKKSKGQISWVGPVLAGGRLWLVNNRGALTAVNPGDGAIGATIETEASYTLPPVVANNTLYLLSDTGEISAYR